jgi:TatA/E family protein of Tat protein translocase
MGLGSLGISELVVIFIIVLVFFGPRRFPEIARSMGSAMREFRRSLNQIQRELEEVDPRKDIPGKEFLDEIRSVKNGSWLDPAKSASRSTPGTSGPQQTGEATGAPAQATATPPSAETSEPSPEEADAAEQLPMFGAERATQSRLRPADPAEEEEPTGDSRSG